MSIEPLDLAALIRTMQVQSGASDINSPNNIAGQSKNSLDTLLKYATPAFQKAMLVDGKKSIDIESFLREEKQKNEIEARAIAVRREEARVATEERIAAITERVEKVQELAKKAQEATVIVGELLEVPANEIAPTDTLGDIILRVSPEKFEALVRPEAQNGNAKAEAFLGATADTTEHAVETLTTLEDLAELKSELSEQKEEIIESTKGADIGTPATMEDIHRANQELKEITKQIQTIEAQEKEVSELAPQSPISTAVVAGTREEVIERINPEVHKRCCTEFNKLNEACKILVEIGFLAENGRELTEEDLLTIWADAEGFAGDVKESYFTNLAKRGEQELDLTYGSEIDVSKMHKTHHFADEIIAYGPDKIQELKNQAQEEAKKSKNESPVPPPTFYETIEAGVLGVIIPNSDFVPIDTTSKPGDSFLTTSVNNGVFTSVGILREDGKFTISHYTFNSRTNETTLETTKLSLAEHTMAKLKEEAEKLVSSGIVISPNSSPNAATTTPQQATAEAGKSLSSNNVSSVESVSAATDTAPSAPVQSSTTVPSPETIAR